MSEKLSNGFFSVFTVYIDRFCSGHCADEPWPDVSAAHHDIDADEAVIVCLGGRVDASGSITGR